VTADAVTPLVLFDFADPLAVRDWAPIDDRVMGGLSRSRLRHDPEGYAVFEGEVSLARGGGFASVRSAPAARGLRGATACLVELRGQGRPFKLNLLADDGFDALAYQAALRPAGTGWTTLAIAIGDFRPTFRGREVPGVPPLDPARLRQVGLMTATREAGPFELQVRRICLA
jgi:hypothetical protein